MTLRKKIQDRIKEAHKEIRANDSSYTQVINGDDTDDNNCYSAGQITAYKEVLGMFDELIESVDELIGADNENARTD